MRIALFLKLGLLALVVVLGLDGANMAKQAFGADTEAGDVARTATQTYSSTKSVQAAYDSAVAALEHKGDVIDASTFVLGSDGSVSLIVRREVSSVLLGKLHKDWTQVAATGRAASPSG